MGPRAGLDRCGKSRPDEYSIRGPYNPWRITTTPSRPKILWRYRHEYSFDLPLAKHQWPHCLSKSRSNKAILYDLAQNWRNICFSSSEGRGIEILLQMYIHLHVKCSLLLSDCKQTWIFSTDFGKCLNERRHENLFSGSRAAPCGPTDMTKLIAALRSFTNALHNG